MPKVNIAFQVEENEHRIWVSQARAEKRTLASLIRYVMDLYCNPPKEKQEERS